MPQILLKRLRELSKHSPHQNFLKKKTPPIRQHDIITYKKRKTKLQPEN